MSMTMAQLALFERLASVLRDGFIPADKPSVCFMCFTQFYRLCTGCPDDSAVARLTSKCAAFLDTLARFVMAEGYASEDRRAILSSQLLRNWKQCQKCRSHTPNGAQSRGTGIFDNFLDKGCDLLATALEHSGSLSSAGKPKPFRTKAGSWPQNKEHIFPYGAAVCVSNLVTASDICTGTGATTLLTIAMTFHRSLLFEEALRHRGNIVQRFISGFQSAAQILQDVFPLREQREDDDSTLASSLNSTHIYPVFLETIFFGTGALPGDHRKFVLGYEGELYRAIVDVLAYFSNARAWTAQLSDVAGLLYVRLPASGRHNPPLFIRNKAHLAASESAHPYLRLARLLRALTLRQSCSGPDCGRETQSAESSTKFQMCARCKMVRYCSKECQRADWKHDPNPHKEICDILNELCAIADPKSLVFEFLDACQERQFPLERAQRLVEWICGLSTTVDAGPLPTAYQDLPTAYKELLTDTIGAAEKAGLEEEFSENSTSVTLDYYAHYVYLNRRN
ncbi:hypothetical protein EXIGLDRAFT_756987 [Exidia glandulosa HHB12029]|uniref:MYND-type domain-containing protein n=1 Tax=Exidia glandulosa HHB12029 TaxID=1314781 RepID=A0A165AUD9_EXIGL|nr:hypothetical protein EXIGLDRAFT_756987 [Exidia glandulosa HHB12029]